MPLARFLNVFVVMSAFVIGPLLLANDKSDHDRLASAFIGADPYKKHDVEAVQEALQMILDGDEDSVFLPGARLAPLTRSLLKLEALEGRISQARFRIRYGQARVPNQPKAAPLTISLVQIDRFNLGPARQAELEREYGADKVRAESFADDEHISWRFLMNPVMGTTAMTSAAARAAIPQAFAETMDCLGTPCTATTAAKPATDPDWQDDDTPSLAFQADYATERYGVPSPAALLDLLLIASNAATANDHVSWRGYEWREGVNPGTPFVDIVIETGLGQDAHIAGLLRDDHLMDHETRTQWIRLRAVATAPGEAPILNLSRALVPWPRPQFD